jgi:hypothetical protein
MIQSKITRLMQKNIDEESSGSESQMSEMSIENDKEYKNG